MTAQAAQARVAGAREAQGAPASAGLSALFAEHATRRPEALALLDQAGREDWCGRPRIAWSYGAAQPIAERLARFFAGLGLAPGAPVAICLPAGSEALLTVLSLERAGLTPCLLPIAWTRDDLARAIEATGCVAVVTQSHVGALKPAETFRDIAMAYFGVRFVMAFGPHPPDGVLDLDRVIVDEQPVFAGRSDKAASSSEASPLESGIVTPMRRGETIEAVLRPFPSWLAATRDFLSVARYGAQERIVSLMAPDDLSGLVTGFLAALVSGSPLETHGLFDGPALAASLGEGVPTRLVAPGWMEPHLAATRLPTHVTGLVLVHHAPTRFRARACLGRPVVDVLALDPWALVTRLRGRSGQVAIRLDDRGEPGAGVLVRRDEDGLLSVSGPAAAAMHTLRGTLDPERPHWRVTGYRADVFAGIVIGVS